MKHDAESADDLRNLWQAFEAHIELLNRAADTPQSWMALAWMARITSLFKAIVQLHALGLRVEAEVMMRSVIEHSVAVAWLAKHPAECLAVIEYRDEKHRRNVSNSMTSSGWTEAVVSHNHAAAIAPQALSERPTLLGKFESFEQACTETGLAMLYPIYRMSSEVAHPTFLSGAVQSSVIDKPGVGEVKTETDQGGIPLDFVVFIYVRTSQALFKLLSPPEAFKSAVDLAEANTTARTPPIG